MPLTREGKKVMSNMKKQYGDKAEEVFYASINANKPGSTKWHKKTRKGMLKRYNDIQNKRPE